ncbi:uncharacterized protein LY79DRAFT_565472 [Colletotrichum navitas]|uniref:Uncharacterized protein n=1 Tax=Colletotrichum navitas TaxID=681940 RepID=A0AAD8V0E4_9PEZI|nr:uncharacterized protein LY79DRAFT_565472 [Colletotrichum navitas]KAK1574692.1 hypothetical protein LY79DRAFT_565472 [Colletotrichum navitas]
MKLNQRGLQSWASFQPRPSYYLHISLPRDEIPGGPASRTSPIAPGPLPWASQVAGPDPSLGFPNAKSPIPPVAARSCKPGTSPNPNPNLPPLQVVRGAERQQQRTLPEHHAMSFTGTLPGRAGSLPTPNKPLWLGGYQTITIPPLPTFWVTIRTLSE